MGGVAARRDEGAARAGSRSWRVRIPTPIVVTLLGAVLSVLVAPAVSRQWEDRRTARELKAGLAEDVGAATARTITRGLSLAPSKTPRAGDEWLLASLRLEGQMRAYFPGDTLRAWHHYDRAVHGYIAVAEAVAHWDWRERHDPHLPAPDLKDQIVAGLGAFGSCRPCGSSGEARTDLLLESPLPGLERFERHKGLALLSKTLLDMQQHFVEQLLRAHPAGLSTTRGDLLRELLP